MYNDTDYLTYSLPKGVDPYSCSSSICYHTSNGFDVQYDFYTDDITWSFQEGDNALSYYVGSAW